MSEKNGDPLDLSNGSGRETGNCEEELPKKPVGRLSADCWPTVGHLSAGRRPAGFPQNIDYQSADSRPTNDRQLADSW